jgi:hypothetical protein
MIGKLALQLLSVGLGSDPSRPSAGRTNGLESGRRATEHPVGFAPNLSRSGGFANILKAAGC